MERLGPAWAKGAPTVVFVLLFVAALPSSVLGQPVMNNAQAGVALLGGETPFGLVAAFDNKSGCDPSSNLTLTGIAMPDGQGSMQLTGMYAGQTVNVACGQSFFDVFFDINCEGAVGLDGLNASAKAAFSDDRKILVMNGAGSIGTFPFDWVWIKNWLLVIDPLKPPRVVDDGLFVLTFQGKPVKKWKQKSFMFLQPVFKYKFTKTRIQPTGCKLVISGSGTTNSDGAIEFKGKAVVSVP